MQLTANFWLSEWTCKDGTLVPRRYYSNARKVARAAQMVRYRLQIKLGREVRLTVNSGYRTEAHNARVGGETNSRHLRAYAGDFYPIGCTVQELYEEFEAAIRDGDIDEGGLGMKAPSQSGGGFVHYDPRGNHRRWGYHEIETWKDDG